MHRTTLPITALPAWAKLNDVDFLDTCVTDLGTSRTAAAKGFGITTSRSLSSRDVSDLPTLLIIPRDLVLSAEAVEEHAKADQHFREVLERVGGRGLRDHAMLFLLMQMTISNLEHKQNVGLSGPWTEYVKLLPGDIPVPTMWSEEERYMLKGTSLEVAVSAKMEALQKEFDHLREKTEQIGWCQKCWWENGNLRLSDWVLLDAWYRSRSLELPHAGEAMVPGLDMANHSSASNAYWEEVDKNVVLLLRPDLTLETGSEITISYGTEKSAAEMLFSYGFVDEATTVHSLVLPVPPFPDDPFGKAKVAAFGQTPTVSFSRTDEKVEWKSPFLYLMCLNEEDGLDFKILQETDGSRSALRTFWQEKDVTGEVDQFETHIADHPLKAVFQLRVVALLQDRIRQQLECLYNNEQAVQTVGALISQSRMNSVLLLRRSEMNILEAVFEDLDNQKNSLLEDESVLMYLGSMDVEEQQPEEVEATNEDEEDFS
ncbi:hypothetical protein BP5796_11149 [Coleophoma crateriformis]|uniref:SET domain-containing protein n=1 Tax=Coleophoma crateriformis TaxID=565419 RepID=A0A3D8QM48_9HELO|nr:hypothetical protein BP5796_11149 [Coleophoma crateriformis]